jgi:hypothetical protein
LDGEIALFRAPRSPTVAGLMRTEVAVAQGRCIKQPSGRGG